MLQPFERMANGRSEQTLVRGSCDLVLAYVDASAVYQQQVRSQSVLVGYVQAGTLPEMEYLGYFTQDEPRLILELGWDTVGKVHLDYGEEQPTSHAIPSGANLGEEM